MDAIERHFKGVLGHDPQQIFRWGLVKILLVYSTQLRIKLNFSKDLGVTKGCHMGGRGSLGTS